LEKHNQKRLYNGLFYFNAVCCVADLAFFFLFVPHQAVFLICAGIFGFSAYINSKRLAALEEPSPEEKQRKRKEDWLKLVGKEEKKDDGP